MDPANRRQLEELVSGRWDPRRGVGPRLGYVRWILTWVFLCTLVFGRFVPGKIGQMPLGGVAMAFAFIVPPAGLIACWLLPISIRTRTRRRYAAHGGFLCPWCRYPLTGLPEHGRCPECGSGFDAEACRTLYDCAYRAFRPDQHELARREREAWTRAIELRKSGERAAEVADRTGPAGG